MKADLLSTKTNINNLNRECKSDEETASLTSNSSWSETENDPRCEERRNRRSNGEKKKYRARNGRRSKRITKITPTIVHDTPTQKRDISISPSSKINLNPRRKERRSEEKISDSRTNNIRRSKIIRKATSTHDAPLQKKDIYFALDCEMVGVGPGGLSSALARITIINWDNQLVFDTYVKVRDEVTDYRTFISGIKQEHIESDSAMTLEEAQYVAYNILAGKILIGHGLYNDLKAIGISHPWCDIRDTATYQPYMRPVRKGGTLVLHPRKLRDLAWETLGKQIQTMGIAHSPIEDAITAMELYKTARNNWEINMMNRVNSVMADHQNKIKRAMAESQFRKVGIESTSQQYHPIVSAMHR